jgi:predicted GIY-YIG superfamily endonuclease
MENKYEEGKIYRLVCEDGHYYIGSTIQSLTDRFKNHKTLSKQGVNKVYEYINDIGWENMTIELLEDYPCQNKKELSARENTLAKNAKEDPLCLNFHEINIYKNGKIYRIQCTDGYYYIGSTTQKLMRRLYHHKETSKKDKTQFYNHMNKLGWEHAAIELIEDYPCQVKQELSKREDEYIMEHKEDPFCLNLKRAHLTVDERKEQIKEYTESHREEATERTKEYRKRHHEEILEKEQTYREAHRAELAEKQREYTKTHSDKVKETRKKQYEKNKEEHLAYMKAYKEKNKEKIKEQKLAWQRKKYKENAELHAEERKEERKQKTEERIARDREIHTCDCGGTYQFYQKKRHMESKKHTTWASK